MDGSTEQSQNCNPTVKLENSSLNNPPINATLNEEDHRKQEKIEKRNGVQQECRERQKIRKIEVPRIESQNCSQALKNENSSLHDSLFTGTSNEDYYRKEEILMKRKLSQQKYRARQKVNPNYTDESDFAKARKKWIRERNRKYQRIRRARLKDANNEECLTEKPLNEKIQKQDCTTQLKVEINEDKKNNVCPSPPIDIKEEFNIDDMCPSPQKMYVKEEFDINDIDDIIFQQSGRK